MMVTLQVEHDAPQFPVHLHGSNAMGTVPVLGNVVAARLSAGSPLSRKRNRFHRDAAMVSEHPAALAIILIAHRWRAAEFKSIDTGNSLGKEKVGNARICTNPPRLAIHRHQVPTSDSTWARRLPGEDPRTRMKKHLQPPWIGKIDPLFLIAQLDPGRKTIMALYQPRFNQLPEGQASHLLSTIILPRGIIVTSPFHLNLIQPVWVQAGHDRYQEIARREFGCARRSIMGSDSLLHIRPPPEYIRAFPASASLNQNPGIALVRSCSHSGTR